MYHIKKDKRSILSSSMIYGGLKRLLATKKLEDISITELVEEAGVSRATFYRNYDSVIDVLIMKSDHIFEGMLDHLKDYHKKSPVKRGSEFLVPFLMYFDDKKEIIELLLKANRQDVIQSSMVRLFEGMFPAYYNAVEKPTQTWDYFIAIRTGITVSILVQWVKDGSNIPPEELGQLISGEMAKSLSVDTFF